MIEEEEIIKDHLPETTKTEVIEIVKGEIGTTDVINIKMMEEEGKDQ